MHQSETPKAGVPDNPKQNKTKYLLLKPLRVVLGYTLIINALAGIINSTVNQGSGNATAENAINWFPSSVFSISQLSTCHKSLTKEEKSALLPSSPEIRGLE